MDRQHLFVLFDDSVRTSCLYKRQKNIELLPLINHALQLKQKNSMTMRPTETKYSFTRYMNKITDGLSCSKFSHEHFARTFGESPPHPVVHPLPLPLPTPHPLRYRVPKCDVAKNKFVKLSDLVPFSNRASLKRGPCQKLPLNCNSQPKYNGWKFDTAPYKSL